MDKSIKFDLLRRCAADMPQGDDAVAALALIKADPPTMRELLEAVGCGQNQLSRDLDIPLRTIQGWCATGHNDPPPYLVILVGQAIGAIPTIRDVKNKN